VNCETTKRRKRRGSLELGAGTVDAEGGIGGGEIGTRVGEAELGLGLVERR
jgi:hypothetical protein